MTRFIIYLFLALVNPLILRADEAHAIIDNTTYKLDIGTCSSVPFSSGSIDLFYTFSSPIKEGYFIVKEYRIYHDGLINVKPSDPLILDVFLSTDSDNDDLVSRELYSAFNNADPIPNSYALYSKLIYWNRWHPSKPLASRQKMLFNIAQTHGKTITERALMIHYSTTNRINLGTGQTFSNSKTVSVFDEIIVEIINPDDLSSSFICLNDSVPK